MTSTRTLGIGVVGFGLMGRTHAAAWEAARASGRPCRLVVVCDSSAARLVPGAEVAGNVRGQSGAARLFDPAVVRTTTNPDDVFHDPEVDVVSICTRTATHVELAAAALRAGKHVLVEKPVGLTADDVAPLRTVASHAGTLCMPAHCMRFWPGWTWLRAAIRDGRFGSVRSAVFQRLGTPPAWSPEFYRDSAQTGGALVDLHIHDVDFIRWCFGDPVSVVSTGTLDHVTTFYRYGSNGPSHVVAEGAWDHAIGFGFRMRFVVAFERATADFDLGRDPRLVVSTEGQASAVDLEPIAGYDGEVRHLADVVLGRTRNLDVTVDDAWGTARILDAERESLARGAEVGL